MAHLASLIILVVLSVNTKRSSSDGDANGAVIVYHSRFLRPNSIFEITVSSSYTTDVEIQAIIKGGDGDFGDAKITVYPGERKTMKLEVEGLAITNRYRLELFDSICEVTKTSELELLVNESLVLVQLDKPVYRPADAINYRVLVLDADLRLDQTSDTVDIRLLSSDNKEIDIQRNQRPKFEAYPGFFEGFFTLPNFDPEIGRWTIEVAGRNFGIVTKTLPVEEYQLPSILLDVSVPSFVLAKQQTLRLTFQITNQLGHPISGTATPLLSDSLNPQPKSFGTSAVEGSLTVDYELDLSHMEAEYCHVAKDTKGFLNLTVIGTDTYTRKSATITKELAFFCTPFKIVTTISQQFFQPAVWNNATVTVMTHDGHKYHFTSRNIWTQEQFVGTQITDDDEDGTSSVSLGKVVVVDEDTAIIPFKTSSAAKTVTITVTVSDVTAASTFTARGGYALLHMTEFGRKYRAGDDVTFSLECTQNCRSMEYAVVSRKGVLFTRTVTMVNESSGELFFTVTSDMAPTSKIVAYYFKDADLFSTGGEIRVDETSALSTVQLTVRPADSSLDHVLPGRGSKARIRVSSTPNSLVGVLAVDKTALQLKSGNDITPSEVAEKYRSLNRPGQSVDSTECKEGQTLDHCYFDKQIAYFTEANLAVHLLRADCSIIDMRDLRPPATLRADFRDSCMFVTNFTDSDGFVTFESPVPDSVTTWSITVFAASTSYRLGLVKAPTELKVYQDFYISVDLPNTLIENESGYTNITVFNVRGHAVSMSFILEIGTNPPFRKQLERSSLRAQRFRFPLGPFQKSVQNVKASLYLFDGVKDNVVDQVQKVINIKHSGVVEYRNSDVIKVTRGTVEIPLDNLDVEREGYVVPESNSCQLRLYADPFGIPVQDISVGEFGSATPSYRHSAEQIISRLMANVLFMKFMKIFYDPVALQSKPNEAASYRRKTDELIRNLKADYRGLLRCRLQDGSYNTQGRAREAGSTWLTAFIARGLILAKNFIPINDNHWEQSLKFLESKLDYTGNFREYGEVADTSYQGGATRGAPLTAFVLLAFTEADPQYARSKAVQRAQASLEFTVQGHSAVNPYTLAICCYALKRLGSSKTQHCRSRLEGLAKYSSGKKYWTATSNDRFRAILDTETTAYALLTLHDITYMRDLSPVIGWLLSQQRNKGKFRPTQDRIMILQALTDTVSDYLNSDKSLSVEIFSDGVRLDTQVISPYDDEPKYCPLPSAVNQVTLKSSGDGIGRCQVECKYNKQAKPIGTNRIMDVRPSLTKSSSPHADIVLEVCIRYKRGSYSGTVVVDMSALSGFKFVNKGHQYRRNSTERIKSLRYEEDDTKAYMRLTEVSNSQATCAKSDLIRTSDILSPMPRPIHVYLESDLSVDAVVEYSLNDVK